MKDDMEAHIFDLLSIRWLQLEPQFLAPSFVGVGTSGEDPSGGRSALA